MDGITSLTNLHFVSLPLSLSLMNSGDTLQPGLIESRSHINSRQIRCSTLDSMRYSSSQLPSTIRTLHHQRSSTVALEW